MAKGNKHQIIVIAWTRAEVEHDGRPFAADLGRRPRLVDVVAPKVAIWLNRGSVNDVARAQAYVKSHEPETGKVFTYPTSERDPLGRARREILAAK